MIETIKPLNIEELRAAVAGAAERAIPLEILGRGSKRDLGHPVEAQAVIDLSRLSGVRLYEPEELVLKAGAGTSLAEIEAVIAQRGQILAFEPPDLAPLYGGPAGSGSIGGAIACNLGGPRRLKAGAARDHFLGFAAVSGRGEVFKAGGRVVKNVTGYDLAKLLAGSFGTLAVMSEITFKVVPAPEAARTLLVRTRDDADGLAVMTAALGSPHEVSAAAHLPGAVAARAALPSPGSSAVTALRLEGFGPSVAARVAAVTEMLGSHEAAELDTAASRIFWRELAQLRVFAPDAPLGAGRCVWRLSLPPSSAARTIAAIARRVQAHAILDWGGARLWLAVPESGDASVAILRKAAAESGGHAMLVRAPDALRARIPVFPPQAAPLAALSARVKEGFDPRGILNPGRMVEGV